MNAATTASGRPRRYRLEDLTDAEMAALISLYMAVREPVTVHYEAYCAAPVPGGYDTALHGIMTGPAAHEIAWSRSRSGLTWRVERVTTEDGHTTRALDAEYRHGRRVTV